MKEELTKQCEFYKQGIANEEIFPNKNKIVYCELNECPYYVNVKKVNGKGEEEGNFLLCPKEGLVKKIDN